MLKLIVPMEEGYDEATSEFVVSKSFTLELEHSLVSLSKWEAKFEKPFLGKQEKSAEEVLEYIRMMILTPDTPPDVLEHLSRDNLSDINTYIEAKMTATKINDVDGRGNQEIVTSELIYYWMVAMRIPFECQYWHLNRLIMLIRVYNVKNKPPKKMSRADAIRKQRETNAQRRAATKSRG